MCNKADINSMDTLKRIIMRLPPHLQAKWAEKLNKLIEAEFSHLTCFVEKRATFAQQENDIKNSRKNWHGIKKNVKELLIELYVSRMRNKYSLSIKQARYLLSTILIAMVFKAITVNDIDYSNGRINKIEGINFTKKQVIITRNLWDMNLSFTSCIFVDKKFMAKNWEKYLESLRKITQENF